MFTPNLETLTALDFLGVVVFGGQSLLLFAVWFRVRREDRLMVALAVMYLATAARFATGVQIRALRVLGLAADYEWTWRWAALVIGVGLIASTGPVLWVYLADTIKGKISQFLERLLRGLQ